MKIDCSSKCQTAEGVLQSGAVLSQQTGVLLLFFFESIPVRVGLHFDFVLPILLPSS